MGSSVSRAGSRKRSNFSETNEKKYFGIRASFDDPWISFLLLKITIFTYVIQSRFTKNYNGEVKTKSLNPFSSYSSMQLFKIIREENYSILITRKYVRAFEHWSHRWSEHRRALYKNQLYAANTVNREMLIIVGRKKRVNYRTIPTRLPTDSFHKIYKISPHPCYTHPLPHSGIFRRGWNINKARTNGWRKGREEKIKKAMNTIKQPW